MTENSYYEVIKREKKSKIRRMFVVFAIVGLGLGIFSAIRGCMSDISPDVVNLAVKKGGKTYVYSNMGKFVVETQLKQKQSPSYTATTCIYKDDALFIVPNMMNDLVNVLSNNLSYYDFKEKSFDGYVTFDTLQVCKNETRNQSTANIGEQLIVYKTTLNNANKTLVISWSLNTKTSEYRALKNCELHSFYTQTSPYPGKTVTSSSDYIVIPLDKVAKFYNRSFTYDEEQKVLFIK